ncbi:hypothetical protein [Coleofasciculus sp. H7-2]|uniref:hypothetical protein n=1 Tax=Coleofasciculus sp. H7-2 TaxID=3351545 RepID=UPI0036712D32
MQPELSRTEAIKLAKKVANSLPSPPRIYHNENGCVQLWPDYPSSEKILPLQEYPSGTPTFPSSFKVKLLTITFEGEAAKQQNDSFTLVQKLKNIISPQKNNSSVDLLLGGKNVIFFCNWEGRAADYQHTWWFYVSPDRQVKFILESGDNLTSYFDYERMPLPC